MRKQCFFKIKFTKSTAFKTAFWGILFLISSSFSFAQIDTKIDRNHIKIGEPIQYSISVPIDSKSKIQLPVFKDTLSFHIEILDQKIDTLIEGEKRNLVQHLRITSFDEGEFLIRSLPVIIDSDTLLSHSFQIKVDEVKIDSANLGGFPVKPIMDEKFTLKDYWNQYWKYVVGGILLLLAVLFVLYFLAKKKRKRKIIPIKTPYEEATDALKALDKRKLLAKSEIKPYYSELSFILRRYLGRVYGFSSLELLSDDLVDYFQKTSPVDKAEVENLKQFLYDSDLVKYAKAIPEESKHPYYRKWAADLIEKIKPIEVEEEDDASKSETKQTDEK